MSQHPRSVPSGSGLAVREGFNNALDSAFTLNSGPSAPASPQAGLLWLDTATGILKIRNDTNTAWVDLADRLGALRQDGAQTLTSGQKQQVRENIAALSYDAQSLTSGQRQQARDNIGAGSVSTENVVPLSKGGTGMTDAPGARYALEVPYDPSDGRWAAISTGATGTYTLPSGGTWAWFCITDTATTIYSAIAGVLPGGSTINAGASNRFMRGFAWRIK